MAVSGDHAKPVSEAQHMAKAQEFLPEVSRRR